MAIASFTREIRAQAQLDHEHLVRAFDAGHEKNVYYLVTEYIPGTDLRRYVRSRGPLGMREVVRRALAAVPLDSAAAGRVMAVEGSYRGLFDADYRGAVAARHRRAVHARSAAWHHAFGRYTNNGRRHAGYV